MPADRYHRTHCDHCGLKALDSANIREKEEKKMSAKALYVKLSLYLYSCKYSDPSSPYGSYLPHFNEALHTMCMYKMDSQKCLLTYFN